MKSIGSSLDACRSSFSPALVDGSIIGAHSPAQARPMSKSKEFSVTLDAELCARFQAAARHANQSVPAVVARLMEEFIGEHEAWDEQENLFRRKIELARVSMRAGVGISNDEVEAEFSALRFQADGKE